jgi:hypothetical protein
MRRTASDPTETFTAKIHVAESGCNWNSRFGARNGNKQTFVHGDWQRQPSTPNGGSVTAAATAGFDPKRR